MNIISLDIETSGLNPDHAELLAVGLCSASEAIVLSDDSELRILDQLEDFMKRADGYSAIVTWNGEEFDLPFLAAKYNRHGLQTKLEISPRNKKGKYGHERFKAQWGHLEHVDLAGLYQSVAAELAIPWSLKPVSRRILGVEPVEEVRSGQSIAKLSKQRLSQYVASDAWITYLLARRLLVPEDLDLPEIG